MYNILNDVRYEISGRPQVVETGSVCLTGAYVDLHDVSGSAASTTTSQPSGVSKTREHVRVQVSTFWCTHSKESASVV